MKCFVYAILVDGIVRYIGKGSRSRHAEHMQTVRRIARHRASGESVKATRFYNKLTSAWLDGRNISYEIIMESLNDEQAFALESKLISKMPDLWNLHPGGRGMTSDFAKELWANDPNAERRRKQFKLARDPKASRDAIIKYWADESNRIKRRVQGVAYWADENNRMAQSQRLRGKQKPNGFGAAISKSNKRRWSDRINRKRQSELKKAHWADSAFREKMILSQRLGRQKKRENGSAL